MLKEIQENLNTQDNRATANPIFIVYDWEKVPSCSDYTDKFMFVDTEGHIADDRKSLIEWLKNAEVVLPENYEELDDDDLIEAVHKEGYDHINKVYYIAKKVFINVFFTEKSADAFIKSNNYHYTKEVHTYVDCLWRNPEMQYIRNGLKEGLFTEKEVKPNSSQH